mmetsp:Transcript_46309/g.83692  ORF Transcript_46309/g.83692 Transcript_46309/m.83692 type:complete len:836 (+) Transcript_46309:71-2578(+)
MQQSIGSRSTWMIPVALATCALAPARALYGGRSPITQLVGQDDQAAESNTADTGQDAVDQIVGNLDVDEDSLPALLRSIWGSSQWPLPGKASVPPQGNTAQLSRFMGAMSTIPLTIFCLVCGSIIFLTRQPKAATGTNSEAEAVPAVLPASPAPWWPRSSFAAHLHALSAAIMWRQLHRHSVLQHLWRCALPAALLWAVYWLHGWIIKQLSNEEIVEALKNMGENSPSPMQIADAVVEYAFTVTLLYVTISAMGFFAHHVCAESESGLRKLLHVSGLSRMAYMVAVVAIDGVGQAMMGLCVMIAVAGTLLQVRMAMWTSPTILTLVIVGMVTVTNSMVLVLPFFFRSARTCSIVVNLISVVIMLSVPFTPFAAIAPQSLRGLLLPIVPGYRSVFELVAACAKGRCLQFVDIFDAWHRRDWVPIWGMLVASPKSVGAQLTPVGALLSFSHLLLLQFVITWGVVFLLDSWRYPTLHATGAQSEKVVSSKGVVLEVKGLEHRYGWLQKLPMMSEQVLSGVSFSLSPGTILGLLGPNGAGKTTTIRCITGEEQPCQGSVAIHAAGSSAIIGLCPQETIVHQDLTVRENMLFFAFLRGKNDGNEAGRLVEHFLSAARLKEKEHCFTSVLSGGMLRRLGVCCAMIGTPRVAILDEPTTGLDPVNRRGIWSTINDVKSAGSCCLMTTHMLEEAEALCSYMVILRKGVVAAEGSTQQLKDEWGTGYMLNIDSNPGEEALAMNFVASLLYAENRKPIKVTPQGQMTFKLMVEEEALGHLIIAISKGKESNGIKRWGISQASLEDAYVRIIQDPREESSTKDKGDVADEVQEDVSAGSSQAAAAV